MAHHHTGEERARLEDLIRPWGVGRVQCGGHEILQRIFVTVRDRNWQEVPPTQWHSSVDVSGRTAILDSRHTSEQVDFEWQGSLKASDDLSTLHFAFEGRALRDMEVCRLGLVVLHPLESVIGAQLTASGPGGVQRLTIAEEIHPQPIIDGVPGAITQPFSELTLKRADWGQLRLKLTGDLFELEDQRNWGDASFKTYCTPLRAGFPRAIARGTVVRQAVDVTFGSAADRAPRARRTAGIVQIGRMTPICGETPTTEGMLGWDHVQWSGEGDWSMTGLPSTTQLELALSISETADLSSRIGDFLIEHHSRIARILLRDPRLPLPTTAAVEAVRKLARDIPLFVAPNGYFVEFNRKQVFDLAADGVAFPLSSTVHAADAEIILANIDAVVDMVTDARKLTGKALIAISPLALHYPEAGHPSRFPNALVTPWLTALIVRLQAAGVASVTLDRHLVYHHTNDQAGDSGVETPGTQQR